MVIITGCIEWETVEADRAAVLGIVVQILLMISICALDLLLLDGWSAQGEVA